ncbi:unnamed protein product [Rhizopus stolonifer]
MSAMPSKTFDRLKWENILTLAKKLGQARVEYQTRAVGTLIDVSSSASTSLKKEDAASEHPKLEELDVEQKVHSLTYKKVGKYSMRFMLERII